MAGADAQQSFADIDVDSSTVMLLPIAP